MCVRYYLGRSGSGKSRALFEETIKRSMDDAHTEYLIIVPDQFTMETQKELCKLHPNNGIMNIDVLSFQRLTHRIFDEVYVEERTLLDDTGKNLIIRQIAGHATDLDILGPNMKKIGYVHEVKSIISEFMQYDIKKSDIDTMVSNLKLAGALRAKLIELGHIYDLFLEFMKDRYITSEEMLDVLRASLSKSNLIKNAVIIFDGFTGFTPVQDKVVMELMKRSKEVIISLTTPADGIDELGEEHELFYLPKKTYQTMERLRKQVNVERGKDVIFSDERSIRFENNETLGFLEKNLFREEKRRYDKNQESIFITSAINPKQEIQQVCLKIRELLREEQYCYRDIAVICADLEGYGYLIEQEFFRHKIPYYMDQNNGLMFHPMIHLILGGLWLVEYDFSYDSVFHYLRNGLLNIPLEEIDQLDNYVRALGIRGRKKYENLFVFKSKLFKEDVTIKLEEVNGTRQRLIDSLTPFLTCKKEEQADVYLLACYEFCNNLKLQTKMNELADKFIEKQDFKKAKEYQQVYKKVMDLLDQIHELLGEETIALKDFIEILTAGFSELKIGTIPQSIDQIVVGDMERTRLKEIKVLFFLGVNDGNIPKSGGAYGIISDMERELLLELGYDLSPTKRMQMFIMHYYIYLNVTKPSEKLFLSFSKLDNSGKNLQMSYFIEEIRGMFQNIRINQIKPKNFYLRIETKEDGLDDMAALIAGYASNTLQASEDEFFDLVKIYKDNPVIDTFIEEAFFQYEDKKLSKEMMEKLYGIVISSSVSRLEKYASCGYAHFIKYGLKLMEEQEYSFEAVDLGTVFHDVIARFPSYLEEKGENFFNFKEETRETFIHETLESVAVEYGSAILYSSARNQYILKRMERVLNRTLDTIQFQLKKGLFNPVAFEVPFEVVKEIVVDEKMHTMKIKGRIDRIDKAVYEGNTYLKIIDYKTGNQKFDLVNLYHGLQMQLALYLNVSMKQENEKKDKSGGEIIPAAILYYRMQDPFVAASEENTEEQIKDNIRLELVGDGLINESDTCVTLLDQGFEGKSRAIPVERKKTGGYTSASKTEPENDMHVISKFVEHKMEELTKDLIKGDIRVNPHEDSCMYCKYNDVCKFDAKKEGFELRSLDNMKQEEALERMREIIEREEGRE